MSRWRLLLLTTSAILPIGLVPAYAGPNGASVVAGSATVQGQGTASVVVNQSSQSAIINWNTFNIGVGESTKINMPGASSVELDRVTGELGPSQILGSLTSNGNVFLVNRDGILFGQGAKVNVGGLLATTNDIANSDFMAGRYNFSIPGNPSASVVNQGSITAQTGGFAALVAPGVRNTGTIAARLGTIALASGNAFTLDFYGDNLITLGLDDSIAATVTDVSTGQPLSSLVSNAGKLKANGGTVQLTAVAARQIVDSVINNTGDIEANSVGTHNGMIVLSAATAASKPVGAPTQAVKVSGTLSAAGKRKGTTGGTIEVTGENVQLSGAKINTSGETGGGAVLIGGDWGGGNPNTTLVSSPSAYLEPFAVPTANTVLIDAASTISASAWSAGNGGKVIVWSNEATTFYGTILAQGGAWSGQGGFVETSGHELTFNGSVKTSAANGQNGTLLLDPLNAIIATTAGNEVITASSIQSALSNGDVVVTTAGTIGGEAGDITIAASLSWANASTLTLNSYRDIDINDGVTISNTSAGNLLLHADATGTGIGTVNFLGTGQVDFSQSTGTVSIFYNPADNPVGSVVNATSYTQPFDYYGPYVLISGSVTNQLSAYMLVNTAYDLQNIQNNSSGSFTLGRDIDASATANWNGGAGFIPMFGGLFGFQHGFDGLLDGQNHVITNLTINDKSNYGVGLFAGMAVGSEVKNLGLENLSLQTNYGDWIGGIVGYNSGTISNSFVTGSIKSTSGTAGGLAGYNQGAITQSYSTASVDVSGQGILGGLVGSNAIGAACGNPCQIYAIGTITASYSTGAVTGGQSSDVGGLVGGNGGNLPVNDSEIAQSFAVGNVGAGANSTTGGLVGRDYMGTVADSYWDSQSTNQATTAGGGMGLTTSALKMSLPNGFDPTVWGSNTSINNGYPYLLWQTASNSSPAAKTFMPALGSERSAETALSPLSYQFGQVTTNFVRIPVNWQIAPAGTFGTPLTPLEKEIYPAVAEATGCALLPGCAEFASAYATRLLLADAAILQLDITLAGGDMAKAREQLKNEIIQEVIGAVVDQFHL